jgi:hypothetical protein
VLSSCEVRRFLLVSRIFGRELGDSITPGIRVAATNLTAMESLDSSQLEHDIASLNGLCDSLPECDAKGKLRGKLGRLQAAVAEYKGDGDIAPLVQELSVAHGIVQRFHDAEPLTQMLETLSALRRTVEQPAPRRLRTLP